MDESVVEDVRKDPQYYRGVEGRGTVIRFQPPTREVRERRIELKG